MKFFESLRLMLFPVALGFVAGIMPASATAQNAIATGGDEIRDIAGYRVHFFRNTGVTNNFVVLTRGTGTMEYLVVAGGGAGGNAASSDRGGGGGGAGGVVAGTNIVEIGVYPVMVGAGGGMGANISTQGFSGENSSFLHIIAVGGGGGGSGNGTYKNGLPGGSGGGGGANGGTAGAGTPNQGYAGGAPSGYSGGGGGGVSEVGAPGTGNQLGGSGGAGIGSYITGPYMEFGGGGGGGSRGSIYDGGYGGDGGGGQGFPNSTPGAPNSGGGGGGGGVSSSEPATRGQPGGSGVVIVRYAHDYRLPVVVTLAADEIEETSALLNADMMEHGLASATVTVFWDTTDKGTVKEDWANSATLTNPPIGPIFHTATGLAPNTQYYFTCYATNQYGGWWSQPARTFKTRGVYYYVSTNAPVTGDGSSWANAFTNIQSALSRLPDGGVICLAGHSFSLTNALNLTNVKYAVICGGYEATNTVDLPGPRDPLKWPTVLTRPAGGGNYRLMTITNTQHAILRDIVFAGGNPNNAHGGALFITNNIDCRIQGCKFAGNKITGAGYGAAVAVGASDARMEDCLVVTNGAGDGIYLGSGALWLQSCTVVSNAGHDLRVAGGSMGISNSIIWGVVPGIIGMSPNEVNVYTSIWYSCTSDGYNSGIQGCIKINPKFADMIDCRLQSFMGRWANGVWVKDAQMSPCIDAANPVSDYSNEPLPNGGRRNMGAYGNTAVASKSYEGPELLVSAHGLTNAALAGINPEPQTFVVGVTSLWGRDLSFELSTNAAWLRLEPTAGVIETANSTQTIEVIYNTAALPIGEHEAIIHVKGADSATGLPAQNAEQDIDVRMLVLPPPTLSVTPGEISSLSEEGENALSQVFWVSNSSPWFSCLVSNIADPGAQWLSVAPLTEILAAGEAAPVTVVFSNWWVERGSYESIVALQGSVYDTDVSTMNAPSVPIHLNVIRTLPRLGVTPTSFDLSVEQGHGLSNRYLQVQNTSLKRKLVFSVSDNAVWFVVNPPTGSSTGDVQTLIVSFDVDALPVGNYAANITLTGIDDISSEPADDSPRHVPVRLTVLPSGGDVSNRVVYASQGSYSDKIQIGWSGSAQAAWYELWRNDSFDLTLAGKVAEQKSLAFTDLAVSPGLRYYYWARPVSSDGIAGSFSTSAVGWRALSPPTALSASAGVYSDSIRVEWSASEGADSYEVWRGGSSNGQTALPVYHTTARSFMDGGILPGSAYYYWVRSRRADLASGLSDATSGYAMGSPAWMVASKGDYTEKVRISWPATPGALTYEVWRSPTDKFTAATRLLETASLYADDYGLAAGSVHTYWVRAKNPGAQSEFCAPDRGYRATGLADLEATGLVWLPGVMAPGQAPEVVSWAILNKGPGVMTGNNTRLEITIWATNRLTGARSELGAYIRESSIAVGERVIMTLTAAERSALTSLAAGEYDVYLQARHSLPSTLGDGQGMDNVTQRAGSLLVREGNPTVYQVRNDYNADGKSDLAVVHKETGEWFVRGITGEAIVWAQSWGGAGLLPVLGDFDADKASDLAAYHETTGRWFVYSTMRRSLVLWNEPWGKNGYTPVWGDFDGDGCADMAVYDRATGAWYIRGMTGAILVWAQPWGGADLAPVSGDFDGDGRSDLAVYSPNGGRWFIRSLSGGLLLWGEPWGGAGLQPVAGDFDGDGKWDLAVYNTWTGAWYIRRATGEPISWGLQWGGYGMTPVAGDFDGDGKWDLAVYHEASGGWYILSLSRGPLLWGELWGGPGFIAL